MIEYYKKVNYLNELENIIQTMKNLQISKEEIDKAEELKKQITDEPDVTLEDVMTQQIELTLEGDFETRIKEEIEKLKSKVPIYIRDLEVGNNTEKYKSILENNIELLKYVPIEAIKRNPDFYDRYFKLLGIDINEFLIIDEKVQQLNQDIKEFLRLDKRVQKFDKEITKEVSRDAISITSVNVKESSEIFRLMPDKIKEADPKWCKRCVARDKDCFQYVPDKVKEEDPDWCKKVVLKDIGCFQYVPDKVKEDNPEWCKEFVKEYLFGFKYVPDKVKEDDPDWCKECVDRDKRYFQYVPDKVKEKNPEWCKDLVLKNINCFKYLPNKMKEENPYWCKDIVNGRIVNQIKEFFRYVPDKVKEEDPDWCKKLVFRDIGCFQYVPDKIKEEDPQWCKDIVNKNIACFQYVPDKVKEEDPNWCKLCVERNKICFQYVPDKIKEEDPIWYKNVVSQDISLLFQYMPDKVKEKDIDFCESVIMQTPFNYIYLPEKVKDIIAKSGNINLLEKIIDIDPYRVITLNTELFDKYYERIKKIQSMQHFEFVAKSMGEYIDDFYDKELNVERMKKIAPSKQKEELQTKFTDIDVMKNIYEGISSLETDKESYQQKADELLKEYERLSDKSNYEEFKALISKIAILEVEIGAKNNSYNNRKEAEEVYSKRREELLEMISKIKTMNPELAEKYEQDLKGSDNLNIEHMIQNGVGYASPEQIELESKVQFYLNNNSEPSNNQLVIYNQKNNTFLNRIFGKLFKGKKKHK